MRDISIRLAVPEDVQEIRSVHRQSILDLAALRHPKEIVDEWGTNRNPEAELQWARIS